MTVNTRVIKIMLEANFGPDIEIMEGLRVQILEDISQLPRCSKAQFAAFIADQGLLIVWDDQPDKIISRVERLEAALIRKIWGSSFDEGEDDPLIKKSSQRTQALPLNEEDLELSAEEPPRRTVMIQSWLTAATLAVTVAALGAGWRQIAIEIAVDGRILRLLFLLAFLPQAWLALVSSQSRIRRFGIDSSSSSSKRLSVTLSKYSGLSAK
jgi:hypothetical protein